MHIYHRNPVTSKEDVGIHLVCYYSYYSYLCTFGPTIPTYMYMYMYIVLLQFI